MDTDEYYRECSACRSRVKSGQEERKIHSQIDRNRCHQRGCRGLSSVPSGTLTVVVAGSPTQIRVETSANGTGTVVNDRSMPSGSTLTVYAVGRDAAGNFVSNVAADSWSLQNKTGGVADGDLVGSADRKTATFTARLLGGARIRATLGTLVATNSGVLTVVAGPATTISASAGTPQSTRTGTVFPTRFGARVRDAAGNPVKGIQVVWSAPGSGASGTFAPGGSSATTDSSGVAVAGVFIANTVAGTYTVVASLPGGPATANYFLANTVGVVARLRPASGTPQQTQVTSQFPVPLAAILADSLGNVVSGVPVTFAAPVSGPGGTFPGGSRTATVPPALPARQQPRLSPPTPLPAHITWSLPPPGSLILLCLI